MGLELSGRLPLRVQRFAEMNFRRRHRRRRAVAIDEGRVEREEALDPGIARGAVRAAELRWNEAVKI